MLQNDVDFYELKIHLETLFQGTCEELTILNFVQICGLISSVGLNLVKFTAKCFRNKQKISHHRPRRQEKKCAFGSNVLGRIDMWNFLTSQS